MNPISGILQAIEGIVQEVEQLVQQQAQQAQQQQASQFGNLLNAASQGQGNGGGNNTLQEIGQVASEVLPIVAAFL